MVGVFRIVVGMIVGVNVGVANVSVGVEFVCGKDVDIGV